MTYVLHPSDASRRVEDTRAEGLPMEKRYYTAETLRAKLDRFEAEFGSSSDAFYRAYVRDDSEVPWFDGIVWADTYREYLRLSGRVSASARELVH